MSASDLPLKGAPLGRPDRANLVGGGRSGMLRDPGLYAVNTLRLASNVADTETVVIGNDTYEFDRAANGVTAGRLAVTGHSDDTPTNASTALVTAINSKGTERVTAVRISANEIRIYSKVVGAVTLACTETLAGSNNAWAAAAMFGGRAASVRRVVRTTRVPTAVEVALGNLHVQLPFTPTSVFVLVAPTATLGALKAWDGVATISGGHVTIDNSGSTDWAATDTLFITAQE